MSRLVLLLLLVGCSAAPPLEPIVHAPSKREALTADVARLTAGSCGSCHTKSSPEADPKALAVFDYERVDWPTMLDAEGLDCFRNRARGKLDEAGQTKLDEFIRGELGLRGASASIE